MTKSRAALIVFLALFVLFLHLTGIGLQLYWRINWYHWIVHTLAGAVAALAVLSVIGIRHLLQRPFFLFLGAFLISLVIGVLWEAFEVYSGIETLSVAGSYSYTVASIVSDLVGGVLAGVYLFV